MPISFRLDPLMPKQSHSADEAEQLNEMEGDAGITGSPETSRDLKLKELPLVHQAVKKSERVVTLPEDEELLQEPVTWILGGPLGSRSSVLKFRCSALSEPPIDPPANELHMTYKTIQAETKLLVAVLNAHGMREELKVYPVQRLIDIYIQQMEQNERR